MNDEDGTGFLHRAGTWLQATPLEVVGLCVLLVGACALSLLAFRDASSRPTGLGAAPSSAVADAGSAQHAAVPLPPGESGASTRPPGSQEPSASVTVHVSGAVVEPGVVRVPDDARVADAIMVAGGAARSADLARINLARLVQDGEQIRVLRVGEEQIAPLPSTEDDAGPLNLNTASAQQLERLPGIGPARAEEIVAHRDEHGRFEVPGDLRAVPGIGEVTFQRLADEVTVG